MTLSPKQKAGGLFLLLVLFSGGSSRRSAPTPKKKKGKRKTKAEQEAARQERVLKTLPITRAAALKYDVPLPIVLAVLDVESWGWPRATSNVGAKGYMQLMPDTAKDYLPKGADVYDPVLNIDGGVHLLSDLYNDFGGDWYAVFSAYNTGPYSKKYTNLNPKTKKYTKKYRMVYVSEVLSRLEKYKHIK